ncbi:MAG: serine/threonine protein kinase [Sandaracinaceae bacterium]|nr:serine/threonine protein kinase [Sandaracinaceae bacterium]
MTAERDADPLAATLQSDDAALAHTVEGPRAPGTLQSSALTSEHPGRYTRAEELGRGGMGRVVLAVDRHLGREVAMKELLAHAGAADSAMSVGAAVRFLREARITGQLEHPSIVPVHELGQREDGTIYYTMKRIRGRSLAHALREGDALSDRLTLIGHFRAACDAVAYAHSRGVVHRDLKPDNVMVGEFGETLVVDWGLAKVRGEAEPGEIDRRVRVALGEDAGNTVDGHALGTPAYMSPEQARGEIESIDERSDVWGLGAMLYEILTGRPPYVAESVLAVVNKVLEERPPRVREVCPEAPAELAAIAERALSRDPGSRYPGAKELAAEIAAWQDGRTVRAYEYSALELVRRFFARHRGAAYATLGVLAALVTAALLTFDGYAREQRARALAEQRGQTEAAQREARGDQRARRARSSPRRSSRRRSWRATEATPRSRRSSRRGPWPAIRPSGRPSRRRGARRPSGPPAPWPV